MMGMPGGCPMCGMPMGGQTMQQAPNLGEIRHQIENLQHRLNELQRGQTTPEQVQQQMPQMCPMCQGMMAGMSAKPSREEVEQKLQQQIHQLEQRIAGLERKSA